MSKLTDQAAITVIPTILRTSLLALLLCIGCACVATKPNEAITISGTVQAETAMSETTGRQSLASNHPYLLPEEIESRLLKFIDGIKEGLNKSPVIVDNAAS